MIDFWKNKRQRTWKTILIELLIFALPLFQFFYGVKCLITLHGREIIHIRTLGPFSVPVEGMAAVTAGLGYMSISLFIILLFTDPPDEKRWWVLRFLRGVICWGSAVASIWLTLKTRELAGIDPSMPNFPMWVKLKGYFALAFIFVPFLIFFAAIFWAMAMEGHKIIKQDLSEKGLEPVNIRAKPLSYWGHGRGMAFRVIYLDKDGFTHRAYCSVSGRHTNYVTWFKDEIDVINA